MFTFYKRVPATMVKVNYHIHSTYSDGRATILEYVKEAVRKGFHEIAFTEHLAIRPGSMKKLYYSIDASKIGDYVEEVREAEKSFKGLKVKAGLEVDYFPGSESLLKDIFESNDLDFTMVSIHWIGEFCLDCVKYKKVFEIAVKEEGFDKFYSKYLRLLGEAVESGLFKVIAHFDVVRNWGFKTSSDFKRDELKILERAGILEMAVEVSSKGLRNPIKEPYPTRRILEYCGSLHIPITLGTDAHRLNEIDANYDSIVEYARSVGYSELATFNRGKLALVSL
ncbi:MAG: histidinol-phosphatase [Thermoproteota archaeon]